MAVLCPPWLEGAGASPHIQALLSGENHRELLPCLLLLSASAAVAQITRISPEWSRSSPQAARRWKLIRSAVASRRRVSGRVESAISGPLAFSPDATPPAPLSRRTGRQAVVGRGGRLFGRSSPVGRLGCPTFWLLQIKPSRASACRTMKTCVYFSGINVQECGCWSVL